MKLHYYNNCVFCGSKRLVKSNIQKYKHNFYTKAISSDFEISNKLFSRMKIYECKNCYSIQNNPWFTFEDSFKIFNHIYGQHNRSWQNLLNFFIKDIKPDHGNIYKIIKKNFNVKKYAEFNSPFTGLMINYFDDEYKLNLNLRKGFFNATLNYLTARQVVNLSKNKKKERNKKAIEYLRYIKNFKDKYYRNKISKFLLVDNSNLTWVYNDNYKSVNSKVIASKMFDMKIINLYDEKVFTYFDLFGIFHTLDHTHQPKKILDFALNNSKIVIIYCHVNRNIEKQHLFSLTEKFKDYLKKRKIFFYDVTNKINKRYMTAENYIICSKKKFNLNI